MTKEKKKTGHFTLSSLIFMPFIPSRTRSTPTAFLLESINPEAIITKTKYRADRLLIHLLNATKESAEKKIQIRTDVYHLMRKQINDKYK